MIYHLVQVLYAQDSTNIKQASQIWDNETKDIITCWEKTLSSPLNKRISILISVTMSKLSF